MTQLKNLFAPYLGETSTIDFNHPSIIRCAKDITADLLSDPKKAINLFYYVRDNIWYDPYYPFYKRSHYQASNILKSGRGFCVSKAVLLCALLRACNIPSRIGFATVKNHMATKQLIDVLGSNLFVYHGYTEIYLNEKWVIATPAFNAQLCERHQVHPLEFDGINDSVFQSYNLANQKFMEYVEYHGTFADVPFDEIMLAWEKTYGKDRVALWIQYFENLSDDSKKNFYKEDVLLE